MAMTDRWADKQNKQKQQHGGGGGLIHLPG